MTNSLPLFVGWVINNLERPTLSLGIVSPDDLSVLQDIVLLQSSSSCLSERTSEILYNFTSACLLRMKRNWFLSWYPQMLVLMVLSLVAVVMSHTWSSWDPERNTCGYLRAGKPATPPSVTRVRSQTPSKHVFKISSDMDRWTLTNDVPEPKLPCCVSPVGKQGEGEKPRVLELGPQHPELLVVEVPDALHRPGRPVVEEDTGYTLGVPWHHHTVPLHMKVGLPLTRVADPEQVSHVSHTRSPYIVHSPGHKLSTLFRPDDHRCLSHSDHDTRPCLQGPNSSRPTIRLQDVLQNLQRVRARVHKHVT